MQPGFGFGVSGEAAPLGSLEVRHFMAVMPSGDDFLFPAVAY